jgi:hypothetical protein
VSRGKGRGVGVSFTRVHAIWPQLLCCWGQLEDIGVIVHHGTVEEYYNWTSYLYMTCNIVNFNRLFTIIIRNYNIVETQSNIACFIVLQFLVSLLFLCSVYLTFQLKKFNLIISLFLKKQV